MRLGQLIARRRSVRLADFSRCWRKWPWRAHKLTVIQAVPIDCLCPLIIPVPVPRCWKECCGFGRKPKSKPTRNRPESESRPGQPNRFQSESMRGCKQTNRWFMLDSTAEGTMWKVPNLLHSSSHFTFVWKVGKCSKRAAICIWSGIPAPQKAMMDSRPLCNYRRLA